MLVEPDNATKIKEIMLRKMIKRSYLTYFIYNGEKEELFRYYENELRQKGYEVKQLRTDKIRGQKGEIIIKVGYERHRVGNKFW